MSLPLLRSLYACGEALCDALQAEELERIGPLTAKRQELFDALRAALPLPPQGEEVGEALIAQNQRLADLLAEQERRLSASLTQTSQQRRAHASYEETAPPPGRLNVVHG